MMDYLRLAPYNINTGETFSLLVKTGGSSAGCGGSTANQASVTFVMPTQCTNPAMCPFKTFSLQTNVRSQEPEAPAETVSAASDLGLQKNSSANENNGN